MRSRGRLTRRRKQSDCGERALDSRQRWASSRINRDDGDRLTSPYPIDLSVRGRSCDDNTRLRDTHRGYISDRQSLLGPHGLTNSESPYSRRSVKGKSRDESIVSCWI